MKRLLLLLLILQPALAQPGGDEYTIRKNLINVRKKLKISHKQLVEANKQEQDMAEELGITEGLVEEFSERLREVRTELALARSRHEILRQQVQESREKLKRKRRALGYRLREMEFEGNATYLQVLLHAKSFTQFMTNGEYLQRVVDSQKKLIESVKHESKIYEDRREEIGRAHV